MGNKLSNVTAIAGIDSYVSELEDIYYERSIGKARFMKTIRGRHKDGLVVVKIFVKPELGMFLQQHVKQLQDEHNQLLNVANVFTFQKILETDRAAYLVRQYFHSSLYDRISTRPFLTLMEKKWIAYQILRGVADAHAKHVCHGDIKTENVLVTSWNWAYLVDFASYKPTYLPEDDPADFSFFFDTSSRRSCYVAPERFYNAGTDIDRKLKNLHIGTYYNDLSPAMDVFSVGCVIAELFLEGTSMFSLSQLFKYRSGEYNPETTLNKIEDRHIRSMVRHMIHIDPTERLTAEGYLTEWRGKAFPHYFYTFLHEYMSSITDKSQPAPRQRQSISQHPLLSNVVSYPGSGKRLNDADEKIERIYHDFDKISHAVSLDHNDTDQSEPTPHKDNEEHGPERRRTLSDLPTITASVSLLPPTLNIPKYDPNNAKSPLSNRMGEHCSLIFLSFVCSLLRNVSFPTSKLKAMDLLLALAEQLPDDVKLDRLVPYLMILLSDEAALVRANAIKTLTQVLCMVESISPINARIFPEYILPSVCEFASDRDVLVRTTYASCIALMAETALRFLEMTQLLKAESAFPLTDHETEELDFESAYEMSLHEMQLVIQEQVTLLLIDGESSVKRALLTNITSLGVFFGRQKANDVLLSHMITYLNDKDWMLRSAFFESIKGVGTFVGAQSLEEYILPLMVQALTDAEEFVVEKVLNSLTSLADLGLFQKMKLWELVGIISPLICHPSMCIRNGAVGFIASATKHLPQTDIWCIIYPLLTPFLRSDIADISETSLLENVKPPIPRQVFEQAIVWASRATERSLFWKIQHEKRPRSGTASSRSSLAGPAALIRQGSLFNSFMVGDQPSQSQEDESFLERLHSVGMTEEEKQKLTFMREYLFKVSRSKSRPKAAGEYGIENGEIYLKNLDVTPMTVFLPDLSQTYAESTRAAAISKAVDTELQFRPPNTSTVQTRYKGERYKSTRVANQPHVQALMPDMAGRSNQAQPKTVPIAVLQQQQSIQLPKSSPTSSRLNRDLAHEEDLPEGTPSHSQAASLASTDEKEQGTQESSTANSTTDTVPTRQQGLQPIRRPIGPGYRHLHALLHKVAMEAFPPHMPDITGDPAVMKRIRRLPQGTPSFRNVHNWKPEGTLVGHFTEHTAGINQLAISWDNLLFASCSDDGSVKIWDCSRLEKNVSNRSRATYNQQGGRIKCITFIEQSYSIASASDNGTIHVFRIDIRSVGAALKFDKCIPIRKYQLIDEYAVALKHLTSNASNTMVGSKSLLLVATTKGYVHALDVLTMTILWKLQMPKSHGVITSMVVDRLHTWLLVGTTRGILTLYDLRFQIPLRSGLHPSKSRISAMMLSDDPGSDGKQVIVAAGRNEVTVWDIVDFQCKQVLTVRLGEDKTPTASYKMLKVPSDEDILANTFTNKEANIAENSIRAMGSAPECRFLVTGGWDRKLRFWDMARIEHSGIVLGLELDEPKPRYTTSTHEGIKFNVEYTYLNRGRAASAFNSRPGFYSSMHTGGNSVVSQQQHLLRNHTDAITDVILTEVPYPMVISGDRDGVIKVIS